MRRTGDGGYNNGYNRIRVGRAEVVATLIDRRTGSRLDSFIEAKAAVRARLTAPEASLSESATREPVVPLSGLGDLDSGQGSIRTATVAYRSRCGCESKRSRHNWHGPCLEV